MTATIKTLGIDKMSVAQRILLAEEIWDSIGESSNDVALTKAQRRDLERRLAAQNSNPKAGSSWDDVKARLSKRS
ncbi:MAG TPA: addiction module protein [Planctomycetota bacterium]|nr:addiction module protein [Planctomycetota bacterium]